MQTMITVRTKSGAAYSITAKGFLDECRAKREGAAAKVAGIHFHDNPYRKGPPTPDDWLYSAWEYGYSHGPIV